jgi:glutamate formiminotransferase
VIPVLECVVNLSEGSDPELVAELAAAAGPAVVDLHSDRFHNRSVLTLLGPDLEAAVRALAQAAVERLDLTRHTGAHPRLGVLDVVPFVPIPPPGPQKDLDSDLAPNPDPNRDSDLAPNPDPDLAPDLAADLDEAVAARNAFAEWAGRELSLPCFLYGPERSLPAVRREAFQSLAPDAGPPHPHPTAGATAVGARRALVAYNLWLAPGTELTAARELAARLRGPAVRALAFQLGPDVQLSFNLLDPTRTGPAAVYDATVALGARVSRTELVGLAPAAVVASVSPGRWAELDLSPERTIEARAGLG